MLGDISSQRRAFAACRTPAGAGCRPRVLAPPLTILFLVVKEHTASHWAEAGPLARDAHNIHALHEVWS